jgi:hypothetical protein
MFHSVPNLVFDKMGVNHADDPVLTRITTQHHHVKLVIATELGDENSVSNLYLLN